MIERLSPVVIFNYWNYLHLDGRLATVFNNLGVERGDSIHIVVGNHHYSLLICFAASYLGASASLGDPALDSNSITSQVNWDIN